MGERAGPRLLVTLRPHLLIHKRGASGIFKCGAWGLMSILMDLISPFLHVARWETHNLMFMTTYVARGSHILSSLNKGLSF